MEGHSYSNDTSSGLTMEKLLEAKKRLESFSPDPLPDLCRAGEEAFKALGERVSAGIVESSLFYGLKIQEDFSLPEDYAVIYARDKIIDVFKLT